jgi:hypothetical protein
MPVTVRRVGRPERKKREARRLPRPNAGWVTKFQYDPNDGFREKDFLTSSDEYVKRFQVRSAPAAEFSGVMQVPVEEGNRQWRLRPVALHSMAELKQFQESTLGQRKRRLEENGNPFDFGDVGSTTSPATRLIDQNQFIPLLGGPFYKQLFWFDYLLMHGTCFQQVNHAALAAAAVKILTRFTVGRGLTFHIKNDQCREVWEEFWERNKLREKSRTIARDITWQGEMMLRYWEHSPGYLTMSPIDASTCWEVVTDPEFVDHVYYYHFQWPAPYQLWVSGQIPITKYIIQQVPPTNVQHVKLNVSAQEKRGRSDLLPVLSWIKRFEDFYDGQTMKAVLEANLVWKLKVLGDSADIDAIMSDPRLTTLPPPGGVWAENEAVDLQPLSAQLTSSRGSQGIGQQLANIVLAGLNLPGEYANIESTGGSARATALVRTDPAVKAVEDRQQVMREMFEDAYDRVIEAAMRTGRISKQAARKSEPEAITPGEPGDRRAVITALR